MGPEADERAINLLHVSRLLAHKAQYRHSRLVNLILELLLNVSPEELQQVLRVLLGVEEAILVQVHVVHERLARVDLRLVVLALHEHLEQALRRLKAEHSHQVMRRIV